MRTISKGTTYPLHLIVKPKIGAYAFNQLKVQLRSLSTVNVGFAAGTNVAELCRMIKTSPPEWQSKIAPILLYDGSSDKKETLYQAKLAEALGIPPERVKTPYSRLPQTIDLVFFGPGINGRIGGNEPGSAIDSPTRITTLEEVSRITHSRLFMTEEDKLFLGLLPGDDPNEKMSSWNAEQRTRFMSILAQVYKKTMTLGLAEIFGANEIVALTTGGFKADILHKMLYERPNENCPATFLRCHDKVSVIADLAAAAKLPPPFNTEGFHEIPA
jgi:6-phosphogluconolactonase/glucosamine-6-phosphate isomerase/deaminase